MFVVNFNEKVMPSVTDATHSDATHSDAVTPGNRADALARAISIVPAVGMTALYDASIAAFRQLQAGGPEKKVIIVISDGGDNASAHKLAEVLNMAEQSSALVYTIGIFDEEDPDKNPDVLRRLAQATGGEAFFPNQLDDVVAICEGIARDIRNQYTIGYVSSNQTKPGAYRNIRLTAAAAGHGKLHVRTRSGYIAGGNSQ